MNRETSLGRVALAVVVLLGGAARFWNLNWDQGRFSFYPDEAEYNRDAIALGPDLNPHFFNYGPLPMYLYRGTAEVLHALTGVNWLAFERFALIGRTYAALASTLTILLVYLAGRRIWGRGGGLLAAALLASAALAIQNAHFGTVDTALTLTGVAVLLLGLRIADGGGARWYALAGAVLGLGLAVKLTAVSFVVLPLLAHGWRIVVGDRQRAGLARVLLLLSCAAVCCLVAAPHYLLSWPEFTATLAEVQAAASDPQKYSFNWQFIGTTPYLFELQNLVGWALGVPLGLTALAGFAWAVVDCGRRIAAWRRAPAVAAAAGLPRAAVRIPHLLLVTVWPALYFLYMGTYVERFIRYLLPLVPFLCLCGAGGLWALAGRPTSPPAPAPAGEGKTTAPPAPPPRAAGRPDVRVWVGWALIVVAVAGAAGWGASLLAVYSRPDTRIAATAWIYTHVPRGSHWLMESGFQQLPLPDAAHPPDYYQTSLLPVSSAESPRTAGVFAARLAAADWLEIPDRRASAVLPRLPGYPVARRFYALLDAGQLGYLEVARFASPPQLGPFIWSDDAAEETFQVFDHPTVRIFQNTAHLPGARLAVLLAGE